MKTSESISEIAKALMNFQYHCPPLIKNATGNTGKRDYRYIELPQVLETIKKPMADAGLTFFQGVTNDGDRVGVTTLLMHASGEFIQTDPLYLPTDKQTAQSAGSAITYAKRYALTAALGIAADEDDDGKGYRSRQQQQRSQPQRSQQAPPQVTQHRERAQPERSMTIQTDGAMITPPQKKALKTALRVQAETHGAEMSAVYETAALNCRIPNKSTNELTRQEASRLIEYLNRSRTPQK